ncbi:MAG: aspartate ammonia-lyase [Candidatus Azotimanducaceae bacterium]|jgi:aspartate ammonia-lyase
MNTYQKSMRIESDSLGQLPVPEDAYYGIQTERARCNFMLTHERLESYPCLIEALALVKYACAEANRKLSLLDESKAQLIKEVCREISKGAHANHFVVDMIQGGAGTSTNMNMNEVIANRGLELMGKSRGDYRFLHPNNDVNMSQSTNDVYASAARLAVILYSAELKRVITSLVVALEAKASEFRGIVKVGRTQLQDAVPLGLDQEFSGFSANLAEELLRLEQIEGWLAEINLGGTAVGTGINTVPGYRKIAVEQLILISGVSLRSSANLVDASSNSSAFVMYSGALKILATKLSKICNDLRLLSSGPRAGFCEIELPSVQPGSSIMPGKINPVIPEAVSQSAFQVIGNDVAVTMAAEAAQLQLNAMAPLVVFRTLSSMKLLIQAMNMLKEKCIIGIRANKEVCAESVRRSIGIATALVPVLGYDAASQIAKSSLMNGESVARCALAHDAFDGDEQSIESLLDPISLLKPNL